MTTSAPSGAQRAISWSWARLGLGVVQAIPATLVVPHDPVAGLALAVGVLPAAAAGLAVRRRARRGVLLVGAVAALALVLGAVAAAVSAVLAVVVLVGLCLASGSATTRLPRPVAALVTGLGLALVGAGFSLDPGAALAAGGLIVVGAAYSWLVALAWPDTVSRVPGAPAAVPGPVPDPVPAPDPGAARRYGRQLAVVGGLAATAGLASGVDHPGWAATSALLVSRPHADALRARAVARSVGVLVASTLACLVAAGPSWLLLAVPPLALGGAGATAGSRWYVTPFFATTIVLSLMLAEHTETAAHWFVERVGATLLGVVVAAVVGWAAARWTTRA